MNRIDYIDKIIFLMKQFLVACLLGPRLVGKKTLAKSYADITQDKSRAVHMFDLEDPQDLAALEHLQLILGQLEG